MPKQKHSCCFILLLLLAFLTKGQFPQHFTYDNNNGLPSNEVYSILTDDKGFLWPGCDAGLYKFDTVRYISYKCATQKSNETLFESLKQFIRTHKSWIINKNHFQHYSKSDFSITLKNGIVARLSKYKKSEFEALILK